LLDDLLTAGLVLVHKSAVTAIHALFEKGKDYQTDPDGTDADSPQHHAPQYLFAAPFTDTAPDTALLTVYI